MKTDEGCYACDAAGSVPRVVTLERTNAMHVSLSDPVEIVTIDVGWTPQSKILPNAGRLIAPSGCVVTLNKPHYEAPAERLVNGVLPDQWFAVTVEDTLNAVAELGFRVVATLESPIRGHAGNREVLAHLA